MNLRPADRDSSSSSEQSADGGPECSYHVDCPTDYVCWQGSCVQTSEALDIMSSADDQCGADRRCRIERLKRKNSARRQARRLEEERYVDNLVDRQNEQRLEEMPRRDKPLGVDLRASRMGVAGLVGGYTLPGRLRPELHVVYWGADVRVTRENVRYRGFQPTTFLIPGFYYFFLDSPFSPYASAAFVYGWGNYNGRSTVSSDDGRRSSESTSDELDTEYHAIELGGGIDYQIKGLGAHLRLGLTYRSLIYNQARLAPGQYHDPTQAALEQWFQKMAQIDVIFLAGWAF